MWYIFDDEFMVGPMSTQEEAEQTAGEWNALWQKWWQSGGLRDVTIQEFEPEQVVGMMNSDFKYVNKEDMEKEVRTYTLPVTRKQMEEDLRDSAGMKLARKADLCDKIGLFHLANNFDKALERNQG